MMRRLTMLAGLALLAGGAAVLPAQPGVQKAAKPAARKPAAPPAAARPWREVVVKTAEGYRMGNPAAAIKLVEYGSRGCPICGNLANMGMDVLVNRYVASGKVSFEYREFWVHGAPDIAASLLGQCVSTAAFFPVLEAMYQEQPELNGRIQALSDAEIARLQALPPAQVIPALAKAAGYIAFIQKHGVSEAQARQCLADPVKRKALAQVNARAANALGVQGTPTFFLNGAKLDGVITWPALEGRLLAAGA